MIKIIHIQAVGGEIEVLDNGVVKITTLCAIDANYESMIIRKIIEAFRPVLPAGVHVRATNNKDEIKMIAAGTLRASQNHADNSHECGLSVANGSHYVGAMGYNFGYLVRGEVCGTGSDGEVLLALNTLKPASPMHKAETMVRRDRAVSAKLRANRGWTDDMMRDAMSKNFEVEVANA